MHISQTIEPNRFDQRSQGTRITSLIPARDEGFRSAAPTQIAKTNPNDPNNSRVEFGPNEPTARSFRATP